MSNAPRTTPPSDTPGSSCGVVGALVIGLSSVIGGSTFATMGEALQGAGGAAPLAYLLGAAPACITAWSYTRLAGAHPGVGGTMGYFNLAYGGGYLSASLNLMLVVCYAAVAALYAGVFGVYVADLFHWHGAMAQRVGSCAGIAVVAWANMGRGLWSERAQLPMDVCKFLIMGAFIVVALLSPLWEWDNFAMHRWKSAGSIITTALTIFMSYQGFELIAAIRRPFRGRALPVAMGLCLLIVTLYYCSMAFCTVGNVNYATAAAESTYLLSSVARRIMGEPGGVLLCTGAIIAAASAVNADVFSAAGIPEEMAARHEMPRYFLPTQRRHRAVGVLFLCGLLILFVSALSVEELTAVSSLGFLVVYTLVNAAALKLCARTPRYALLPGGAGALICLAAACTVAWQLATGEDHRLLIGITAGMLGLPFAWQALWRR